MSQGDGQNVCELGSMRRAVRWIVRVSMRGFERRLPNKLLQRIDSAPASAKKPRRWPKIGSRHAAARAAERPFWPQMTEN